MKFSEFLVLLRKWLPKSSVDRYVYRGELHGGGKCAKCMKIMKFNYSNGIMLFLHTFRPRFRFLYKHNDLGSFSGAIFVENQKFAKLHDFNESPYKL